jgi:uncharacterized Tic20 family protein
MMETPIVAPFVNQIASPICFPIVLKRNNPFIDTNTRSSMNFFYSSSDLLYVIILLKNVKINVRLTTFRTLELYFS